MSTMDKVKNALHLNKDKDTTSTTHTHTTGTHTGATTHTGNNIPEGTAGPHNSRVANAADPRVDSDLDSSRHAGTTGYGGVGSGTVGTGAVGTGHTTHNTHNTHNTSTTAGPHNSNLLNKADPRVDSDRDGSRNMGASTGTTGASAYTSNTPHTGTGVHNAHSTTGYNTAGYNTTGYNTTGTHGGISSSTNAGPHNSNLANVADPRVDSDLSKTHQHNNHGLNTTHGTGLTGQSGSHATPGSGTAQNTAGPHNSDMLNKLDPRVDADLDGSKTYGGNKTHA